MKREGTAIIAVLGLVCACVHRSPGAGRLLAKRLSTGDSRAHVDAAMGAASVQGNDVRRGHKVTHLVYSNVLESAAVVCLVDDAVVSWTSQTWKSVPPQPCAEHPLAAR